MNYEYEGWLCLYDDNKFLFWVDKNAVLPAEIDVLPAETDLFLIK